MSLRTLINLSRHCAIQARRQKFMRDKPREAELWAAASERWLEVARQRIEGMRPIIGREGGE